MSDITNKEFPSKIRKKLSNKIHKLKTKDDYINVFKLLNRDSDFKYTENTNGIWIDINSVSNETINELIVFLNDIDELSSIDSEYKYSYTPYASDDIKTISKLGPKLNNQEKSVIKRLHNNK